MSIAGIVSQRSTCGRKAVGAVLALEGRPLSVGYAGPPSGAPHCNSLVCPDLSVPCVRTIHAEMNAIAFAARKGIAIEGAELYVTLSPCLACAKVIVNSGIKRVYYRELYRLPEGPYFLQYSGIGCEQLL